MATLLRLARSPAKPAAARAAGGEATAALRRLRDECPPRRYRSDGGQSNAAPPAC